MISWQKKHDELRRVESVCLKMLHEFQQNEIHVSWAMVGLLAQESLQELQTNFKSRKSPYQIKNYSPFPLSQDKFTDIPYEIISGLNEAKSILQTEHQELSSHTFSHYYTLEEGQDISHFGEDLEDMSIVSEKLNTSFKSIVFPRNQINEDYLKACQEKGIIAFRGNQPNNYWSNSPYSKESLSKKGMRFLDAYYKVSNTQTSKIQDLAEISGLLNIPASRFFRPHSGKQLLEKRKIKRIKDEMTNAAKTGCLYHLWWHPHNFSNNTTLHFEQLAVIMEHFKNLKNTYGFKSLNMSEIAELPRT